MRVRFQAQRGDYRLQSGYFCDPGLEFRELLPGGRIASRDDVGMLVELQQFWGSQKREAGFLYFGDLIFHL